MQVLWLRSMVSRLTLKFSAKLMLTLSSKEPPDMGEPLWRGNWSRVRELCRQRFPRAFRVSILFSASHFHQAPWVAESFQLQHGGTQKACSTHRQVSTEDLSRDEHCDHMPPPMVPGFSTQSQAALTLIPSCPQDSVASPCFLPAFLVCKLPGRVFL